MAAKQASPFPISPQGHPSQRFPVYEYLYQLNRNLAETLELLELIRQSPGIRKQNLKEHQVEIEHLRAMATLEVIDVMEDLEHHEAAKSSKLIRAYHRAIADPDDVYFEVERREEERRKQGLPSLLGIRRGWVPKSELPPFKKPGEENLEYEDTPLVRTRRKAAKKLERRK